MEDPEREAKIAAFEQTAIAKIDNLVKAMKDGGIKLDFDSSGEEAKAEVRRLAAEMRKGNKSVPSLVETEIASQGDPHKKPRARSMARPRF
jgi:hypothetical protein